MALVVRKLQRIGIRVRVRVRVRTRMQPMCVCPKGVSSVSRVYAWASQASAGEST